MKPSDLEYFQHFYMSCEPPDADPRPYPCFACGQVMGLVHPAFRTRCCWDCDTFELRRTERYYSYVTTVKGQEWLGAWLPYVDHSAASYPSPDSLPQDMS